MSNAIIREAPDMPKFEKRVEIKQAVNGFIVETKHEVERKNSEGGKYMDTEYKTAVAENFSEVINIVGSYFVGSKLKKFGMGQ